MSTITLYSTAACPFCVAAETLRRRGLSKIQKVRGSIGATFEEMINKTGRRTVPEIFINDHVGGFDDLAIRCSGTIGLIKEAANTFSIPPTR